MTAYVAYRNLADTATLSLTAGAVAGYPLANVTERQLKKVCRMTAASSPRIKIDLGSALRTDVFALLNINAINATMFGVTLEHSADDSTYTSVGALTLNDAGVPSLPRGIILAHGIDFPVRFWRVTPTWSRIDAAAYFEVGRLWLGPAIAIKEGAAPPPLGFKDTGMLDASAGAQNYEEARVRVRRERLRFEVGNEEAYGFAHNATTAQDVPSFQGLQMEAGTTGELIALPRTSSRLWMRRTGIYGHLVNAFTITPTAGPNYSVDLEIEEER